MKSNKKNNESRTKTHFEKIAWAKYYEARDRNRELRSRLFKLKESLENPSNNSNYILGLIQEMFNDSVHNYDCPICLEKIGKNSFAILKCGHFLCKDCNCKVKTCPMRC
jgi:hypothetical protein